MSKTILAEVDGFTPIIDGLIDNKELGIIGAAVFGRIWRYCQMSDNVCRASHDRIADELGISRRTIIRYIDVLVSQGYLKDTTPELRNRPHIYADTGKASISVKVGVTESHSDTKSQYGDTKSQPTVTESHMKIVSKIEKKKETATEPNQESTVKTRDIQNAYLSCVSYPVDWRKNEGHAAKWLAENGYTPDDVAGCYKTMKAQDFWKDKPLSLTSLKSQIGQWKESNLKRKVIHVNV